MVIDFPSLLGRRFGRENHCKGSVRGVLRFKYV